MKATNVLMDEHKLILRALNVLEQIAERVDRNETLNHDDVNDVLRFLRLFADDHHQGKEEAVLFPAMRRAWPANRQDALKQMTFEHNQERSLVEGIEDSVRTNKGKDFVYYANRLTQILRNHIYKEDHILFADVDRHLSEEEDEEVARGLKEFDRSWTEKVLAPMLDRLNGLEWKYLSKSGINPAPFRTVR